MTAALNLDTITLAKGGHNRRGATCYRERTRTRYQANRDEINARKRAAAKETSR